jgi:allantoinase
MDGAIRSTRVLIDGDLRPATVMWSRGLITAVAPYDAVPPGKVTDHGDLVVMPALVDSHVHVNEPGRTHWEGFATATAAARAGGVAVIVDMPLNSIPPTTSVAYLERKRRAAAAAHLQADVAFWGGIVPGNAGEVPALAAAGVRGFKCFLVDPGVAEFPAITIGDLDAALEAAQAVGLPLLIHAESPAVIGAVRRTGGRAHILHLSAADALPALAAARTEGLDISVETCPHYLALCAEELGDDLAGKCAPPIRDAANRERLWRGLADGIIDMVVSDHSPCPGALKQGGFHAAWGGIASLELRLPVVWTEARRRGFGIADLARWMCAAPARLAGIAGGDIVPGSRADLVVWDPDATVVVAPERLAQRHPITPYAGRALQGRVLATIVRGGSDPILIPETP